MATDSVWDRSRRAACDEIVTVAMGLFLEKGFAATTIDDIAAAAGVSRRSVFRYFASKEDLVLGHLAAEGPALRATLEQRPADESAWTALLQTFLTLQRTAAPPDHQLKISGMVYGTPSLRARSVEKHLQWHDELVPDIRRRLIASGGGPNVDLRARAVVAAAIACLDTAGEAWTVAKGEPDLGDLLTDAFDAVTPTS
ncbi:TetR/AcrR family transcriptional regulator [Kineococcus sp. NUM-3379]